MKNAIQMLPFPLDILQMHRIPDIQNYETLLMRFPPPKKKYRVSIIYTFIILLILDIVNLFQKLICKHRQCILIPTVSDSVDIHKFFRSSGILMRKTIYFSTILFPCLFDHILILLFLIPLGVYRSPPFLLYASFSSSVRASASTFSLIR